MSVGVKIMALETKNNRGVDFSILLKEVVLCAEKAGEILLSYYQEGLARSYKADGSFATQADIAAERYLIEALTVLIPGAGFYAEESGIVVGNEYVWVIDPLDGTTNFAHGLPYFCTSIALTYKGERILGVIYQPLLKELFTAQKGSGAFLNGKRLLVSEQSKLEDSVITMCSSTDKNESVAQIGKMLSAYPLSLRNFGASALDLAYCAAGKMEACFYQGTSWWDIAAGSLMIEEAGGKVSTFQGDSINPENRTFVGGNEPIFKEVSRLIKGIVSV